MNISAILGVIGLLVSSAGTLVPVSNTQKLLFLIGAIFLISSSIVEKHRLYICLQAVVITGTLAAFLPVNFILKAIIPAIPGIIVFLISLNDIRKNKNEIVGILGVFALAGGFATSHPVIYFIGALLISFYSFCEYRRGIRIALLWLTLNIIFALTSLIAIFRLN